MIWVEKNGPTNEVVVIWGSIFNVLIKNQFYRKYTLKKIVNVEENHDVINGDRYLIELVRAFINFSLYFYKIKNAAPLEILKLLDLKNAKIILTFPGR